MTAHPAEYRCDLCGSSRVQGTAWIDLRTGRPTTEDPPRDGHWCASCEDECGLLYVNPDDCDPNDREEAARLLCLQREYLHARLREPRQ